MPRGSEAQQQAHTSGTVKATPLAVPISLEAIPRD